MNAKRAASIACALLALVTSASCGAAAQRTFVASNGVDTNPCSINLPCRSFGTAIGQTLAGGEVIVQDSAGYGIVTVTKSVSIIAPTGIYAGISVFSGQTGVTINAAAAIVVLRGLSINGVAAGSVNGIHLVQASRLRIESCVIANLASTGIVQDAAGAELIVLDTIVRDNGNAGIAINVGATVLLDRVRVEHNAGDGVHLNFSASAIAMIRNSIMSHNGFAGTAAFLPGGAATANLAVEDSVLSQNAGDGVFAGGVRSGNLLVALRRNSIAGNGASGVSAFAGGFISTYVGVHVIENTFLNNVSAQISADGFEVITFLSRNAIWIPFPFGGTALSTVNSAVQYTLQDNTGFLSGSAPNPVAPF